MKKPAIVPNTGQNDIHYYYLDAVRAFALLLGIFYHGVMSMVSYIPPMVWAVKERHANIGIDAFYFVSHTFRMQAFFLVSGFFAHLVYHKKGTVGFISHRFKRITIPLIIFWPFIFLILNTLWIWGYQKMGYFSADPVVSKLCLLQIVIGSFTTGAWLKGGFPLTHLWFLYYLTWFVILVIVIRFLFDSVIDRNSTLRIGIDKFIGYLMTHRWGSLIFALFTIPAMWFMKNGFGVDTPDHGLVPKIPSLVIYGLYFSIGWFLHRSQHFMEGFKKYRKSNLFLSLVLLILICLLFLLQFTHPQVQTYMAKPLFSKLFISIYGLTSMTTVFAFIGFMMVLFANTNKVIRYLSDSSYWLYVIHLPIVVFFQVIVMPLPLHWTLKISIIFIPSFLIMFFTYHFMVRKTWVGVMLNGKKRY
jgi:glucan biosynthesis protein C